MAGAPRVLYLLLPVEMSLFFFTAVLAGTDETRSILFVFHATSMLNAVKSYGLDL